MNTEDLAHGQSPEDLDPGFIVDEDSGIPERAQRARPKNVDALTWRPRENAAFLSRPCTFSHPILVRSWNPLLARTQITMFMLQEVTVSAASIEEARQVEQIINDKLGKLESSLEAEMTRLKTLYANEGYDTFPPKNYTGSASFDIPVFTPGAGRFLSILAKVDDLFWMVEVLRLQGTIKLEHKHGLLNQWKSLLWGHSRECNSMWVQTKKIIAAKQARDRDTTKKPAKTKATKSDVQVAADASAEPA